MCAITRLRSPGNARIKAVARLRRQRERRRTGRFVAEGPRQVQRAIAAGLSLHELFYCPALLTEGDTALGASTGEAVGGSADRIESLLTARPEGARAFEVTEPLFRKMTVTPISGGGVLAVASQPAWSLAALPTVSDATLYLVAVGIEKPGNLGAIARTAAAAGCEGLLVAEAVVDPFNAHAIRNSTGAMFTLPTVALTREALVAYCREQGVRLAAATVEQTRPYTESDLTGPLAIAVGSEDAGLSGAWREAADATGGGRITIPLRSGLMDSLNAGHAAAVLLFEARRQRGGA